MRYVLTTARGKDTKFRWKRFWRFISFHKGIHRHNPAVFVEIHTKRLLTTIGFLMVAAYISGTIALAIFWGNRPHSPVTYWDVAWPGNWSGIRPKQGQMLIAQADEFMEKEKPREAFYLYRSGLRLYPQDQDARLQFALIMAQSGMLEKASQTLADGLDYGYPEDPQYLGVLLQIITVQHNATLLTEIAPKLLSTEYVKENPERKYELIRQYMQAQMSSGDYIGLLNTAEQINNDPDAPYKAYTMAIAAHLRLGSTDAAKGYIESLPEEVRNSPAIQLLKASTDGTAGDTSEMMAALRRLFQEHPSAWKLQLFALQLIMNYGSDQQSAAYLDLYINTHIGNFQALNDLAVFLTDQPNSNGLKQLIGILQKRRPNLVPNFKFYLVQALITEAKFSEAKSMFTPWRKLIPDDNEDIEIVDIFGDIIEASTDGGAGSRNTLIKNLAEVRFDPEVYWEAALAMMQTGHRDTALSILNLSANLYPTQPSLLALRDAVDKGQTALPGLKRNKGELLLPGQQAVPSNDDIYSGDSGRYNADLTEADLEE